MSETMGPFTLVSLNDLRRLRLNVKRSEILNVNARDWSELRLI